MEGDVLSNFQEANPHDLSFDSDRISSTLHDAKMVTYANLNNVKKFKEQFIMILQSEIFRSLRTFRDQVQYIIELFPYISYSQIALFLGCNTASVRYQVFAILRGPKGAGRPSLLPLGVAEEIHRYISKCASLSMPATICDIQHYLHESFEINILPDTLRKFIKRSGRCHLKKVEAIEAERMRVSSESLADYYKRLANTINEMPADFVLNLDESGFEKFADARKQFIVVPNEMKIYNHPVERNEKRVTLLGCISASGKSLKPLVILSRQTIDVELFELGFTPDVVDFVFSETGYMTSEIFQTWVERTLIPYFNTIRVRNKKYEQKGAIILDNCTCHEGDIVDNMLSNNGIIKIPLIAHSSDKTQMLDIGVFGNTKMNQQRIHPSEQNLSNQTKQLVKLLYAWQASTHPYAITSSFRATGVNVGMMKIKN